MSIYKVCSTVNVLIYCTSKSRKKNFIIFFKLPKFPLFFFYLFDCIGVDDLSFYVVLNVKSYDN